MQQATVLPIPLQPCEILKLGSPWGSEFLQSHLSSLEGSGRLLGLNHLKDLGLNFNANFFCGEVAAPLLRTHMPWHVSSSSVVFRRKSTIEFLVLFHKKARQWVYPGGHPDGDLNLLQVSLREVIEETGVVPTGIFSDAEKTHELVPEFAQFIPIANETCLPHIHLDLVYCFEFAPNAQVKIDLNESLSCRWIKVSEFQMLPIPTRNALDYYLGRLT